ncbi:MAG: hypothetical protein HQK49_13705 [Oligoflexia bacterium]|nr:hypothetical protein [Oligoflexia bacterium]
MTKKLKKLTNFFLVLLGFFFICTINLSYAQGIKCITHGQCQNMISVTKGTRCFIVKTGVDAHSEVTCALRCYAVDIGSYCNREITEYKFGYCEKEKNFVAPPFDPENPDCSNAIDPNSIPK